MRLPRILRLLSLRPRSPKEPEHRLEVADPEIGVGHDGQGRSTDRKELMAGADSSPTGTVEGNREHLITRLDLMECRLLAKLEELERRVVMWTAGSAVFGVTLAFAAGRFV